MKRCRVFWCAFLVSAVAAAEDGKSFTIKATYDRPGLAVPHWEMSIDSAGPATYASTKKDGSAAEVRSFTFSSAGLAKLRIALESSHGMAPCETKTKGIARMGQKTLIYKPAAGPAQECSYNYTENKGIAAATEYLQATALTLDDGAEMERLHRYDRLGLDPVMQQLGQFAGEGRAVELGSIRAELESLVSDAQILERVRTRAAQLLALAQREDAGSGAH